MNIRPSLNKEVIKEYVGLSSFQKGEIYAANKAIQLGKIKNNILTALCQGNEFDPYKVEVIFDQRGIKQSYCSCPVGAGGKCKHIAALLLTWEDVPENFTEWTEIKERLKTYNLQTLLELIDLLEERVEGSIDVIHAFQENLENSKSPYLAQYLKRIEEAFQVSRLPWYHPDEAAATEIAFAMGKIRSNVSHIIETGHFAEAFRIYQALIQHIFAYLDEHQDPWQVLEEEMKGCVDGLEHLLLKLPQGNEWRQKTLQLLFSLIEEQMYRENNIAAEEARRVLVEQANAAEKEKIVSWVKAIPLSNHKENEEEFDWIQDFLIDLEKDHLDPEVYLSHYRQTHQVTKLVESLLHLGRVEEAQLASQQKDSIAQVLPLANIFLRYQQEEMAERLVLESVQQQPNLDLFNWLKEFYLRRNQTEQALSQVLQMLYLHPQFSYYQQAQELAQTVGTWKTLQNEIINFLKNTHQQALLVEIYLDEKNLTQAIEAFNLISYTNPEVLKDANWLLLTLRLVAASRHRYPRFAIQIYQEIVQDLIEERNRESYHRACDYIKIIREIYKENQWIKDWNAYLKNLMQTYSRFKALKDEMQQAGLILL